MAYEIQSSNDHHEWFEIDSETGKVRLRVYALPTDSGHSLWMMDCNWMPIRDRFYPAYCFAKIDYQDYCPAKIDSMLKGALEDKTLRADYLAKLRANSILGKYREEEMDMDRDPNHPVSTLFDLFRED
jgi:hypothetical protein